MSLIGRGAVTIWNGIEAGSRGEFFAWHNREHILERVDVPGFNRGRRAIAIEGNPEFFTLYEVDDVAVLSSQPYLDRLAAPTEWTRSVVPDFTDTARALTSVIHSSGVGEGGVIATLRSGEALFAAIEAFVGDAAERAAAHPEIVGIHLCSADLAASNVDTAERKIRAASTDVPATVLMIEGTDPRIVRDVAASLFSDAALRAAGMSDAPLRGLYRTEISISRLDAAASRMASNEARLTAAQ